MSSDQSYDRLLERILLFLALTNMGLLRGTRSSHSSSSSSSHSRRNDMPPYRPPPQRAAAIRPSRLSMTTARPASQRKLNPQYPPFGLKNQSYLRVILQFQMARSSRMRAKSVERGSRGAVIYSGTYEYTPASDRLYALSKAAGRSSFRYLFKSSHRTACRLMYTFMLGSAPRSTCICAYTLVRNRTAASIRAVTSRLVTRVHLRGTEEHTRANAHTNARIPFAKRRSLGERH